MKADYIFLLTLLVQTKADHGFLAFLIFLCRSEEIQIRDSSLLTAMKIEISSRLEVTIYN